MATFYGYTFAIFGGQSVDGSGSSIDYDTPPTGTWSYSGSNTYFVVEERNNVNTEFEGDTTDEEIARNNQISTGQAQTTNIGGTDLQIMWDYTFTVTDGTNTWRVAVIDVDLNNDNDVQDPGEDGYFLIFPDGMPPADTVLTVGGVTEDDVSIPHFQLGGEVVCFASGTMIDTKSGPRAVETLQEGDLILTRDAGYQPLRWIGETCVPAFGDLAPIVISKGVLGNSEDLVVSPQHAVLLNDWRAELFYGEPEVLVCAKDLLAHDGVYRKTGGFVRYCHILFDAHQLVQAASVWSESLYPGDMTMKTVNPAAREEILTLFPDLADYGPKAARCLRHFEAKCLAA